MITCNVTETTIEATTSYKLTEGMIGEEATFSFSSAWDGLAKEIVFEGVEARSVALFGDKCLIPPEVFADAGGYTLRIGAIGRDEDGNIVIPTIWVKVGKIQSSPAASSYSPSDFKPTPDIVAQIQNMAGNAMLKAEESEEKADEVYEAYKNGELNGKPGKDGEDGHTPERGVDYWTPEDEAVIDGHIDTKVEAAASELKADLISELTPVIGEEVAEQTAEQLAETNRKVDHLWKLSEGVLWDIESVECEGHTTLPKGGEYGNVDEVRGKTEQFSTNGYQLLDADDLIGITTISNNYVFVDVEPSTVYTGRMKQTCVEASTSGAITAQHWITFIDANGKDISGKTFCRLGFHSVGETLEATETVTTPENCAKVRVSLGPYFGVSQAPLVRLDAHQFEKGSVAHDYEPYTGGIPSPSPDYPQEIHSVEQLNVKRTGKNLCETVLIGKAWNNANNSARAIVYAKVNKGKTYTISVQDISGLDASPYVVLKENIGDTTTIASYTNPTVGKPTVITPTADGFVGIQCNRTAITETDVANAGIMLEYGSVSTEYEPYKGVIAERTITPPRPLNAIGEYKDVCDVVNGEWVYANHEVEIKENHISFVSVTSKGLKLANIDKSIPNKFDYDATMFPLSLNGAWGAKTTAISDKYQKIINGDGSITNLTANTLCLHIETSRGVFLTGESEYTMDDFKAICPIQLVYTTKEATTLPISTDDLDWLRNLTLLEGENLFITDNHGRDVSYLMSDFINLKKAVQS